MPPKRFQQPKKSRVELEITTSQKVMVGVALLASIGAFAAGFAAIPSGECNKGDKECFAKSGQVTTGIKTVQKSGQITTSVKTAQQSGQDVYPYLDAKVVQVKSFAAVRVGSLVMASDFALGPMYYKSGDKKLTPFDTLADMHSWLSTIKNSNIIVKLPTAEITPHLSGSRILLRPGSRLVKENGKPTMMYVCGKDSLCRISDAITAEKMMGIYWEASNNIVKLTATEVGFYKKLKSFAKDTDVTGYTQSELYAKFPNLEKYFGL